MKRGWPRVGVVVIAALVAAACFEGFSIGPERVVSVSIDQSSLAILVGQTVQLNAAARDENGVAFEGPEAVWTSSDLDVVIVSEEGRVTGVSVGTATVTAEMEGLEASASITVSAAPALGLSPGTVAFSGLEGGANPADVTIGVANTGGSTISDIGLGPAIYNTGEPTGWLSAALNASQDSIRLRASVGTLAAGTYQARLPVLSPQALNSPQNVFVTFTVQTPVPSIALSTSFVSFAAFGGGADPAAQSVTVGNAGNGTFVGLATGSITYAPGQPGGWLTVGLVDSTVTLQAATGSLAAGTYLATVPVTATNADNSPQQIVVGFSVAPAGPAIGLTHTGLSFSGNENGVDPAPDTVDVLNIGSGVLDTLSVGTITYGAGQPTGWLQTTLTGTVAPTQLVLQPVIAGLSAGSYTATVPVQSPVGLNSPQNLTVDLVLSGSDSLRFDPASGQLATVGTPVSPNPVAIVVDQNGMPVMGRVVSFAASGNGSVSQTADTTNAQGQATVTWTLGTTAAIDSDTLTAALPGGLSAMWVATASAGMATQVVIVTEPAGAVSDQAFQTQPAVRLADAFGNAVAQSGVDVAVGLAAGPGTLSGTDTVTTDVNGVASFTDLVITDSDSLTGFGAHQLTFSPAGMLTPVNSAVFTVQVSFTRNVQKVIQTIEGAASGACTACHPGYVNTTGLVGVATTFNAGCGTLVVAGDTTASILYRKVIAGTLPCGSRMPPGDTLSTVRQRIIRDWIVEGANNN